MDEADRLAVLRARLATPMPEDRLRGWLGPLLVTAFGTFLRVFGLAFLPLAHDWRPFMGVLAAISIIVGSVLAIAQTDIKRLLAYSSIAQAGFILVGLSAGTQAGIQSAMFYLAVYAGTVLGAFAVVAIASVRGEEHTALSSYAGLARRKPLLGLALTAFLLSLAGIPPMAGFIAKVGVFSAAVQAGSWPLVLIAVLASVAAAFFYIRVIVLMFFSDPIPDGPEVVVPSVFTGAAVGLGVVTTLVFGIVPQPLLSLAGHAANQLFVG